MFCFDFADKDTAFLRTLQSKERMRKRLAKSRGMPMRISSLFLPTFPGLEEKVARPATFLAVLATFVASLATLHAKGGKKSEWEIRNCQR